MKPKKARTKVTSYLVWKPLFDVRVNVLREIAKRTGTPLVIFSEGKIKNSKFVQSLLRGRENSQPLRFYLRLPRPSAANPLPVLIRVRSALIRG